MNWWLTAFGITIICITLTSLLVPGLPSLRKQVEEILDEVPLIDGHNDLACNLNKLYQGKLKYYNFLKEVNSSTCNKCQTDYPKLKRGKLGGFFLSAYVPCADPNPVQRTLEQIDLIHRFVDKYPQELKFVETSDGILEAFRQKKIASLIGVEGGHSINSSLALLRTLYTLGARYLTLTHNCDTPWARSAATEIEEGTFKGLTKWGRTVVEEMNRLGMIVDIAHVSFETMMDALDTSIAPVMFSHSSAFALWPHPRNVREEVLIKLKQNGGIIMVNFFTDFIGEYPTIGDIARHINYIVETIGYDNIGIGADYDGVPTIAKGLEDVSHYVDLFEYLLQDNPKNWTPENLKKLAGLNILRVFREVEKIKENMRSMSPYEDLISPTVWYED